MVLVYTDASRSAATGAFGWGAVVDGDLSFGMYGELPSAKNINHAEALAVVLACEEVHREGYTGRIRLYTDCQQAILALLGAKAPRLPCMKEVRRMFREYVDRTDLRWLPKKHPERKGLHGEAHDLAAHGAAIKGQRSLGIELDGDILSDDRLGRLDTQPIDLDRVGLRRGR